MHKRITNFEKMGFGMFVHFGIYSVLGKGEWSKFHLNIPDDEYFTLASKFKVKKNWARELVSLAKRSGCKYITLTTRHHDGFSLYDTLGLNDYDAPHSAAKRDLVAEFVEECNRQGIAPFFYHTLLDWYNKDYESDFEKYIDYLVSSVEILCTQYGKIGGIWFDGYWNKPNADWQFDRLYGMIRKHQPDAMIINNTGMSDRGVVGHPEIDSVTFERGKPHIEDYGSRPVATEMCEIFGDTWGYSANDVAYKSLPYMIHELVYCRANNSNFLLNIGPMGNGSVKLIDKAMMLEMGRWIRYNKNFIYSARYSEAKAKNAITLKGIDGSIYAVSEVPNITGLEKHNSGEILDVRFDKKIKSAIWLDNGEPIVLKDEYSYLTVPFEYGTSMHLRVAKIKLK